VLIVSDIGLVDARLSDGFPAANISYRYIIIHGMLDDYFRHDGVDFEK
jgi:hypothetical protein